MLLQIMGFLLFTFVTVLFVGFGRSQWDFAASEGQSNSELPNRPVLYGTISAKKKYVLSIFFKANWFRAGQYCRHLGMRLATINNQFEEDELERELETLGFILGPIWTSGTDNAEEGKYCWMTTGNPLTYSRWLPGQPNGTDEDNCLVVGPHHGQGYRWSDSPCSDEFYFACEYFPKNSSCPCTRYPTYI